MTHGSDPVPHLPLEAMGFRHPVREVFYEKKTYKLCDPNNGEDPKCSDKYIVDLNVMDHLTYMHLDFIKDVLNC